MKGSIRNVKLGFDAELRLADLKHLAGGKERLRNARAVHKRPVRAVEVGQLDTAGDGR